MKKRQALTGLAAALTVTASTLATSGVVAEASTKSPIRVLVDASLTPSKQAAGVAFPWTALGAQAAAASINASGGINGRPLKIDICDNLGDPNQSAQCARTAKENGDIAVAGSFDAPGAQAIVPVLQSEGIPYIGGLPANPAEYTSPISFQFDPGPVLGSPGTAQLWAAEKCTSIVSIAPANPGNDQVLAGQKESGKKEGIAHIDDVLLPLSLVDPTATVSAALTTKPDCVTYSGLGTLAVKFFLSFKKLGYKGKFITSVGSLLPPYLHLLGTQGNGIIVLNSTLSPTSSDPMVTAYRNDMIRYVKNPQKAFMDLNEFSQDSWSSIQLVKQALAGAKTISSAYLLKKIPTMCNVNIGNVYPHLDFCKTAVESKTLPRVFNDNWQYFVAKNGIYVPTDNVWHNLSATVPR